MTRDSTAKVSTWALLAYALPTFQTSLVQGTAGSAVPTLYATDFGLSLTLIGTVVLISRVFDAFVDPMVGYLSDHTRTRLGRRKPWVIGGSLLTLIATYYLFIPPAHPSFSYFLLWYMGIYLGWSFSEIPHSAWGFEITRDYDERSRLFAFRIFMLTAGSVGFLLLPLLPIFKTTAITPETLRFAAYAVVITLPLAVAAAVIWAPTGVPVEKKSEYNFMELVSIIRGNKPLGLFLAGFLPYGFGNGMFGALAFLYFADYLGIPTYLIYLFIVLHGATLVFLPLVPAIVKRFGKHQTWAISIGIGLAILPLILLVPHGKPAFIPLLLLFIPIGFSNALSSVAPLSAFGDVVDFDTLKTGKKRAATYSALFTLLYKLNLAVGGAVAFMIVGLAGYHPKAANTPGAILGLKIAFIVAPTLINAAAVFFVWKFPLDRRRQAIVKRRLELLEGRRAAAERASAATPVEAGSVTVRV